MGMQTRVLGRTGIPVSALSFGCGALGGLFTRGESKERDRAIARALELGMNYFDTAPSYGDGASERHLGAALKSRPAVFVGTKILIPSEFVGGPKELAGLIRTSVEGSLRRLQRDTVDLLQLHNGISSSSSDTAVAAKLVEDDIAPLMSRFVEEGKARHIGMTALGYGPSIIHIVRQSLFDVAQAPYNLLDTTQDFGIRDIGDTDNGVLRAISNEKMGCIAIRVLAGGALSGSAERHPVALQNVVAVGDGPGQGTNYAEDVRLAQCFRSLIEQGEVESLLEAALRYACSNTAISTTTIGFSSIEQLEQASGYIARGPLSASALAMIRRIHDELRNSVAAT